MGVTPESPFFPSRGAELQIVLNVDALLLAATAGGPVRRRTRPGARGRERGAARTILGLSIEIGQTASSSG